MFPTSLALEGVARAILAISFSYFLQNMNWAPSDPIMLIATTVVFTNVMIGLMGAHMGFINDYVEKNK